MFEENIKKLGKWNRKKGVEPEGKLYYKQFQDSNPIHLGKPQKYKYEVRR